MRPSRRYATLKNAAIIGTDRRRCKTFARRTTIVQGALQPTTRPTCMMQQSTTPCHHASGLRPQPQLPQAQPSATEQAEDEHTSTGTETNLHSHRSINTIAAPACRRPKTAAFRCHRSSPSRGRGLQHSARPAAAASRSAGTAARQSATTGRSGRRSSDPRR